MTEHEAQPAAEREQARPATGREQPRHTAEREQTHDDGAQVSTGKETAGAHEAAIPELVIISGMSGAGRSTAAKCLEDLGWFVVDNLPPALIPTMVELGARSQGNVARIAVVVDVRGRRFFDNLRESLADLDARGVTRRIVFLESSDDALVRRFESVRRPHPLQGDGRIVDGIAAERELLRELRGDADLVIDTSSLNVHELRAKMDAQFAGDQEPELRATVMSFGFKYGLPVDADLVVDMRFLPNPHWVPELRPLHRPQRGGVELRPQPARGQGVPGPLCRTAPADRRGLPSGGQALCDRRRRLHRRQAPVRGHVGEARRPARRRGRGDGGRPPGHGTGMTGE